MKKVPSFTPVVAASIFLSVLETLLQNAVSLSEAPPIHSFYPQGFLIFNSFLGFSKTYNFIMAELQSCKHALKLIPYLQHRDQI
jgi:hypothetical protein